jgi:SARP family transcriptional regulator, regulator of embCAB operon
MESQVMAVSFRGRFPVPAEEIWINLLGTFEVSQATGITMSRRPVQITAAKLRQVLAMLAVNANSLVSTDQLIDELWPDGPPATVKTIVQTYIYQLRKQFSRTSPSPRATALVATRPGGYMLTLPYDNVDIFRFERLLGRGRTALRDTQPTRAADLLGEALTLWRGPVLADVTCGPILSPMTVYLEEQRLEAISLRIDADLANNRHSEVVGELRRLVASHQLHESFYIRLMQALHQSGRRGEALTVYQQLRRMLDQDLGLEPSPEAQQVQREILSSALTSAHPRASS